MKIAVIGGAGVRTPLLVSGLTQSDLPIDVISLYDIDRGRLETISAVASQMAAKGRVTIAGSVAECVSWADCVFTSIRVGGLEGRVRDESTAQRHGIVGQETVGPAGFAMAVRTIPHMVRYAAAIAEAAPKAWIVNFANPVGMVTEAMRTVTDRVIGICDTPTELFEHTAHALGLPYGECVFDYFGLNHLGWLREVFHGGEPQLQRLWNDDEKLRAIYKVPLFSSHALRALKLLPTEYVYYYDQPTRAFDNVKRAGRGRGQTIVELTTQLFETLKDPKADAVRMYQVYLWMRSGSYMQIESGAFDPTMPKTLEVGGYDKIARSVATAIHFNTNAIVPLSIRNEGNINCLDAGDVVEVPCVVGANGARALHVGTVPEAVRPLLTRVKEYERRTVAAALAQSIDAATDALACNPLVKDRETARRLVADLSPLW